MSNAEMGERNAVRYVECPRDAWQGLAGFIPTEVKVRHLVALLDAGFLSLDMGSFVSPKAVPQLADTESVLGAVLGALHEATPGAPHSAASPRDRTGVDFLAIIANERGLARATRTRVSRVGYPLSVNETFQRRNTGRTLAESWALVQRVQRETTARGLGFTVYLSMGFGNPYGDAWKPGDTADAVARLREIGVNDVALADTVGTADAARVDAVLSAVEESAPLGLHLHARPDAWQAPLEVALSHGLRWFEGTLAGVGGCPFAADDLVGNLPTERVVPFLENRGFQTGVRLGRLPALAERAAALSARYSENRDGGDYEDAFQESAL